MKKMTKTPLVAAMGTAVVSSFTVSAVNAAEQNPFGVTELSSGYLQMAEAGGMGMGSNQGTTVNKKEGSCGEGKCGGSMGMPSMNKMNNMPEGKCAGNKPEKKPEVKTKEGGCGEGKCGAMMDNGKMKKGMEGSCGDMMKGKEGACGNTVDKDKAAGK